MYLYSEAVCITPFSFILILKCYFHLERTDGMCLFPPKSICIIAEYLLIFLKKRASQSGKLTVVVQVRCN